MSNKETGLMKKTKKELVDIILRKDDEEVRLNAKIAQITVSLDKERSTISEMKKSLDTINRDAEQYQKQIDEITSQKVAAEEAAKKFEKERNVASGWNCALATAVVIVTALWILL